MVNFELDKLSEILNSLKNIPNIKEVRELRKRLNKEKKKITTQKVSKPKPELIVRDVFDANKRRSNFMKGVWRYVKLVRDTYPELREQFTPRQMFSQFFARRRGEDVDINDVFWQNPS